MNDEKREAAELAGEFKACQKILLALGDENRQQLLLEMMQLCTGCGARVGEITEKTHLSRPAVSHHLKILREAGIIKFRREGTRNYYYFDTDAQAMDAMIKMLTHAKNIMEHLPDRSGAVCK